MRRDRVLLSALAFSVVWHLFWLSALTVVVVPKDIKPVKFSSVSFLGPILGNGMLEMSRSLHERSDPEKRYLSDIVNSSIVTSRKASTYVYTEADLNIGTDIFESDEVLTTLATSAIDGDKIEPGSSQ
ncbi:MAG: hypothetical protein Q7S30_06255 [Candidatus Omnitrophota bacterium]|nr:hypothetical protein [Candidatus Omnitrophota bacterium]